MQITALMQTAIAIKSYTTFNSGTREVPCCTLYKTEHGEGGGRTKPASLLQKKMEIVQLAERFVDSELALLFALLSCYFNEQHRFIQGAFFSSS